jgi:toxoflavin biosynthesis protein ToxC
MKPIEVAVDREHGAPITSVSLRADGLLASGSYDGTVRIWDDADPADRRGRFFRHRRLVNCVAWNPVKANLLASGSADKTVAIWDVDDLDNPLFAVLSRHTDDVNSVSWMPDGRRLVCVSEDGHVTIWDVETARLLGNLGAHRAHCMAVSVSHRGDIASVGEDGLVRITADGPDLVTSTHVVERTYESSIEGCAWAHNGDLIALALDSGVLEVVDRDNLATVETYDLSTSAVRSVAWSPGDEDLLAGTYDGGVYEIERASGHVHVTISERAWPRSIDTGSGVVAVGSFTSRPHRYDASSKSQSMTSRGRGLRGPNAMAVGPDHVTVGTDSGEVLFLDRAGLELLSAVKVSDSPVLGLAQDESSVVGTTYSGRVFRIDDRRTTVGISQPFGAPLPSIAVIDGQLVAGSYGGELIALDPTRLTSIQRRRVHDGSIKSLAAIDRQTFAVASTDHHVSTNDLSLSSRHDLWEHGNLVNAVAQLDGRILASASRDRTVRVGHVGRADDDRDAPRPAVLLGPDESVKAVAIVGTAESFVVIGGSYDFGLYWWDCRSGVPRELTVGESFDSFNQAVSTVVACGPGEFVCAGWDREVRRYTIEGTSGPRVVASTKLNYES